MGKIKTEKRLLKKLNAKNISSLSTEKVSEFISELHNVDPDVAKKIIEQFPDFTKFASQATQEFRNILAEAKKGTKGADAYYRSCEAMINSLQKKLDNDNLSREEQDHIIDKMMEIANKIDEKDERDKAFIIKILSGFCSFVGALVAVALTFVGIKGLPKK